MGTEVLRPQDLLVGRFRPPPASFQRRRNFHENGNLTNLFVSRKQNNTGYKKTSSKQPVKRRFNLAGDTKKSSHGGVPDSRRKDEAAANGDLVMGKVTLLRRGESLSDLASKITFGNPEAPIQKSVDDLAVRTTERTGSNPPVMVLNKIRLAAPQTADVYAGSAFFSSPSPRSVPLPSFFSKNASEDWRRRASSDDGATRDLRRLLRLD